MFNSPNKHPLLPKWYHWAITCIIIAVVIVILTLIKLQWAFKEMDGNQYPFSLTEPKGVKLRPDQTVDKA